MRKPSMLRAGLTAVALAAGTAGVIAAAAPASAAATWTYRGGVNILLACENQIRGDGVTLIRHNVFGWRCEVNHKVIRSYKINLNEECRMAWPDAPGLLYARYTNYDNPRSWGCYYIPGKFS